jgi:periplasmic divalent cation tolerance protein
MDDFIDSMPMKIMLTSDSKSCSTFLLMTDKIVVLSTCATEEEAAKLARVLVEARLAACVTVVPGARSVYRWQGAIESAAECLLIVKSSRQLFEPLRRALEKAHAYEVPELLALPVVEGAANYLEWLEGQLGA